MFTSSSKVIGNVNGRPVMLHNGQPIPRAHLCDYQTWGDWEDRVKQFIDNGVKVFALRITPLEYSKFWNDPPEYQKKARKMSGLDAQVEYILKHQPEAVLFMHSQASPTPYWRETHPDEMEWGEKCVPGKKTAGASLSSDIFLDDLCGVYERIVEYCESRWGDHMAAYLDADPGEAHTWLSLTGSMFDCSPVNQQAFNKWVRNKYSTEAELQAAWDNSQITFDGVRVPSDSEWLAKKNSTVPTIGGVATSVSSEVCGEHAKTSALFHWIEQANALPERD